MNNQKAGDLRLGALIKQGQDGDVVLVGCPFDSFRVRCIQKGGQDNGPCCLRRFIGKVGPLINPEYEIDISNIKITDMGNIKLTKLSKEEEQAKFKNVKTRKFKGEYVNYQNNPEMIVTKITSQISQIMKNNKIPFVFGGSKQCTLGTIRSFYENQQNGNGQVFMLSGRPYLKRALDNNKGTSDNILTILTSEFPEKQFTVFGSHLKHFPSQYLRKNEEGKSVISQQKLKNVKFILYDDIYKVKSFKKQLGKTSKGYHKFVQVFSKDNPVHITLSLEVIQKFLGCRDISLIGLEIEEILQIFMELGKRENVMSIDITEFNPSCEDYESSLMILNMLYFYLMGRASRK